MNIAVVGLGLIGGSVAKALKKHTDHTVGGFDKDDKTLATALHDGVIRCEATDDFLNTANLTIVALPPVATEEFILAHKSVFLKGAVVTDFCGIKEKLHGALYEVLKKENVIYIGAHPMAGKEVSGYRAADEKLFVGASLIITPVEARQEEAVELLRTLAFVLGFQAVTLSSPTAHDKVIAYTSQLAHIVSNAYVKSDTLCKRSGFSAGSFNDLTRVARLDEGLWSELMFLNREPLLDELDTLISNLEKYRTALMGSKEVLEALLKEGKNLKIQDIERNQAE